MSSGEKEGRNREGQYFHDVLQNDFGTPPLPVRERWRAAWPEEGVAQGL